MKQWMMGLLLGAFFLTGCSVPFLGSKAAQAPLIEYGKQTPVEKIMITELDILDRPYAVVGDVNASVEQMFPLAGESLKERANSALRQKAYALNADAIIFVHYQNLGKSWTRWDGVQAKGKAVAFTRY